MSKNKRHSEEYPPEDRDSEGAPEGTDERSLGPPEGQGGLEDPEAEGLADEENPSVELAEPRASAIARLEDQLSDAKDRYLRLAAEFDNFRKRVARERIELTDRAQAALVTRLLDVLDDLDRMSVMDLKATSPDAVHEGMVLVQRKLRKELEAAGLESIDPSGQPFNPSLHEAVAVAPTAEPANDHLVSGVMQVGYRYKGNLIRPARVQVYALQELH